MIVRRCGITIARIGVARWHRRQPRVIGGLVAFEAVGADGWPVGVAIIGRPVSRHLQARRLVEGGASLRGAGWVVVSTRLAVKGKGWGSRPGRVATDRSAKVRWSPAWCVDAVRGSMV